MANNINFKKCDTTNFIAYRDIKSAINDINKAFAEELKALKKERKAYYEDETTDSLLIAVGLHDEKKDLLIRKADALKPYNKTLKNTKKAIVPKSFYDEYLTFLETSDVNRWTLATIHFLENIGASGITEKSLDKFTTRVGFTWNGTIKGEKRTFDNFATNIIESLVTVFTEKGMIVNNDNDIETTATTNA